MLNIINKIIHRKINKFSLKEEADVLNKLSLYLSAHVPLEEVLGMLESQAESVARCEIFGQWRVVVQSGKGLHEAFGDRVSPTARYAAELGTRSGSLAESLKDASIQIRSVLTTQKKVVGALTYPATIFLGTVGLVLGLMMFVFPRITPLFKTLKVDLPISTRFLIWLSTFLGDFWWVLLTVLISAIVSIVLIWRRWSLGRHKIEWVLLRIPVVGKIIRIKQIVLAFDSLATLLRGNEQMSDALGHVAGSGKYAEYRNVFRAGAEIVTSGKSLAAFFRNSENRHIFPMFVSGIIAVGEKTGNMEPSVKQISLISQEELDDKLRLLTSILEPLLMVLMSVVIGFIALSIILPIYGITTHFQNV